MNSTHATKPTVLFIGPTPPPYQGVAVATKSLLNSSLGDHFRLVHLDISDRRPMDNSEHFDLRNVYLALIHGLKFLKLLVTERPRIVYVPISQSALGFLRDSLFMIPSRWLGARLVIHLHGGAFDRFFESASFVVSGLVRSCLSRADCAIVLSEKFRGIFGSLIPESRIMVVENGIDDHFAGLELSRRRTETERLRVLYLGTLLESKGFVDLLRAAPMVLRHVPDTEFLFVGDGAGFPEYEKARAWVRENGLEENVKFLGAKGGKNKTRVLVDADVLAFPTWYRYEGQPLVIIEAMAAGLPVVTTRHAAIETTLGQEGGVYVRPRDPEDLAARLVSLLKEPTRRADMGRKNRSRFLEHYTVDRFAAGVCDTFNHVLGLASGAPNSALQTEVVS